MSIGEGQTVYEVVYWPTERTVVTYDTREEAVAAVAWYERTYDPPPNSIGIREVETSD